MSSTKQLADMELLIAEFKQSGLRELHARSGDFEIFLSLDPDAVGLGGSAVPVQAATPAARPVASTETKQAPAAAPIAAAIPEGAVIIRAPYLGTFYRAPKPGADPYVEIGSTVSAASELCLVEVMKLFTAVRADVAGTVVQVLANDGELVAGDQPLFAVMPA